ncbi:unnamed protein product [Ectocarpus sp. 12 AP-2014]
MAFDGTHDRVGMCQNIPCDPTPQTRAEQKTWPTARRHTRFLSFVCCCPPPPQQHLMSTL